MSVCTGCERPLRAHGVPAEDAPGTVVAEIKGMCSACYNRRGLIPKVVDVDAPCVLVRSDLRPSTYRILSAVARERRVDIGVILSLIADAAVKPKREPTPEPKPNRRPRGPQVEVDDGEIRRLNVEGLSDNQIAKRMNLAQSTVSAHRRAMGLESPTPRAPRPGVAAS